MTANWRWVRHVFPNAWLGVLGLLISLVGMVLLAAFSLIKDPDAPGMTVRGAIIVTMFWWLLLSPRLFRMVWQMVPSRLPGIERTLLRGISVHFVLSIGLPLLGLLLWQPAHLDITRMATALWLGAGFGVLVLSLPPLVGVIPVLIVLHNDHWLDSPVITAGLALIAVLGALRVWHWQLRSHKPLWLAPFAVLLDSPPIQALTLRPRHYKTALASPVMATDQAPSARDVLAAILGPHCQTTRQRYGRRGQWLTWLIFAGVSLSLGIAGFSGLDKAASSQMVYSSAMVAILLAAFGQPVYQLVALHHSRRASLAELRLLPGLPAGEQLSAQVLKQLASCLFERMMLLGFSLPTCAALTADYPLAWLAGWCVVAITGVVLGVISAWLAWHQSRLSKRWRLLMLLFAALGMVTLFLLCAGGPVSEAVWLAWSSWFAATLAMGGVHYRQIISR